MSTSSERILGGAGLARAWPLADVAHTRALEIHAPNSAAPTASAATALATAGTNTADSASQMQLAGLALARLILALAPHAGRIWIACGPGNNGGDGLEAAAHLRHWGKQVVASLVHDPAHSSSDAQRAWQAARAAGVSFSDTPASDYDICVDALFGIGAQRPLQGVYADWVRAMNAAGVPCLAVDIPSGLNADTGVARALHVQASHTLSLLTLKPGLFTADGRDACGEIWFNDLGVANTAAAQATLVAPWVAPTRQHASHKGSYGDVAVVGGAEGMLGAAVLAGRSALHGGAGRVFVCPLADTELALDSALPELMLRNLATLDCSSMTVVAGCGGGHEIGAVLPGLLARARHLVLDADALNRIAENPTLQQQLQARAAGSTVLTPHPLEAARLLATTTADIQSDRLRAAQALAKRYQCVVVLKGSGTVLAAPGETPRINPTGNAKLASAGTGDVLAGLLAAHWASGAPALEAASQAVYRHGLAADRWPGTVLSASDLCRWA